MSSQSWRAEQYSDHASFVSELGSPVVALLAPKPGERILDLGCGDGMLAEKIKRSGAAVHGVDYSQGMVDAAVQKGVEAEVMSGERLTFSNEFDAVFTNAALHWMRDYKAVIGGAFNSLKTPGRCVGEFGGCGNVQHILEAMQKVFAANPDFGNFVNPWFFPKPSAYSEALTTAGFRVESIELIPRPTPLKTGIREWLKIFSEHAIGKLDFDQAEIFLDEVEAAVKPSLYTAKEGWVADYVRLRFCAFKPGALSAQCLPAGRGY